MSCCVINLTSKLEGDLVECIYLRQRSSDGSVNKTTARCSGAPPVGFSGRKIPRSSANTILEKAIRFRHPIQIGLKS